ncbi:MAG: tetratricopeptide repeat protein, partial [Phycisphaerae bacterium]
DPTNQSILVNRANVLAALGREAEAEAAYRGILRLHPDSFEAVVSLHELLRRQKRFDDLITLWRGFSGRMGDENEARACLAWAHALKGDMPAADRLAGGIAQSSSARALADWAWVYDALRREAWDDLEARLKRLPLPAPGEAPADARLLARRREQTRIIAPALADLPESIRQSTAGRYALARLFRFSGEPDLARETCRQLLASPNRDRWTAAAEELLRLIDRERSLRAAPGP